MTTAAIDDRPCEECGEFVTYIPERDRKSIADPSWIHVASGEAWGPGSHTALDRHLASPRPRCPKCHSEAYTYKAEAWADTWDCADCGHHAYYSLGD